MGELEWNVWRSHHRGIVEKQRPRNGRAYRGDRSMLLGVIAACDRLYRKGSDDGAKL